MAKYMTEKQVRFVEEYLKDFRKSDAMRRAGFTGKNLVKTADAMLDKPLIKEYFNRRQEEIRELNNITRDFYIEQLREMALDKNLKPNERTNAMALMSKITGHVKEVSPDSKPTVIINQVGAHEIPDSRIPDSSSRKDTVLVVNTKDLLDV